MQTAIHVSPFALPRRESTLPHVQRRIFLGADVETPGAIRSAIPVSHFALPQLDVVPSNPEDNGFQSPESAQSQVARGKCVHRLFEASPTIGANNASLGNNEDSPSMSTCVTRCY